MTRAEPVTVEAREALKAIADDLAFLARLHDRELDRDTLDRLATAPPASWFSLSLASEEARVGFELLTGFLADYDARPDGRQALVEALAADYADLYLTFGKRLSPTESFWLTEDHIERQEPMFEVRRWYHHHGLSARDWRKRPDDHLVHQLEFAAHLLAEAAAIPARDAGRFLDRHLLRWSKSFLGGMAQQAATPFYAGLGLVTEAALQRARMVLEEITGEPRMTVEAGQAHQGKETSEAAFVPGQQPSW